MTSIPATRSIEHGLPYNAASTRSSHTMVTMITTLIILGKNNWNKNGNLPDVLDVVEDAANICNYSDTDDNDSSNDKIGEEENT